MPHGAQHIAAALGDAHRIDGLPDPADTRPGVERAADGTIRAKGPAPRRPGTPQTAVHDSLGIDHAPGVTRRTVVRTGPKRTDVVPFDDPWHRKPMMCISIL